jgi:hypothetical protein
VTLMNSRLLAARAGVMTLVETALFSVVLLALAPVCVVAQPVEKKGTTPYVTHFIFRPLMSIDIPGLGTATNLEAVGTTQNMKGEKMLDKQSAPAFPAGRGTVAFILETGTAQASSIRVLRLWPHGSA